MNPVSGNPFRVLGLLANATERDVQRQTSQLRAYARVGKVQQTDNDFEILGNLDRCEEAIEVAAARIEQPVDRALHALFWFVNLNRVDEVALEYLRAGNDRKAAEIWETAVRDKRLTKRNYSALLNLGTLRYADWLENSSLDPDVFLASLDSKGRVTSSSYLDDFLSSVTGGGVVVNPLDVFRSFADLVLEQAGTRRIGERSLPPHITAGAFREFPAEVQRYVTRSFSSGPLNRISSQIDATCAARVDNPRDAEIFADDLHESVGDDLAFLESTLGADHPQYRGIANKLAEEYLCCSIDFFNEFANEGEFDPGEDALRLLNYARELGPSGPLRKRVAETAPTLEEWVANSLERERRKGAEAEIAQIGEKLAKFEKARPTVERAGRLLDECSPHLVKLKFELFDADSEFYYKIVDAVAANALGMTIDLVNTAQDNAFSPASIVTLRNRLRDAAVVMQKLAGMDMSTTMRKRCEANGRILTSVMGQVGLSIPIRTRVRTSVSHAQGRVRQRAMFTDSLEGEWEIRRLVLTAWELVKAHPIVAVIAIGAGLVIFAIAIGPNRAGPPNAANKSSTPPAQPGMAFVPGATFAMGRGGTLPEADVPAYSVTLKPFYIDVNEVTRAEYAEFIRASNRARPGNWTSNHVSADDRDLPVIGVTYYDADAYCKWKSKRLPTESEWELAASGPNHLKYPWGNAWAPGNANAGGKSRSVVKVGSFTPKSSFGLNDTIGNAWEWTSTDFRPYPRGKLPKNYRNTSGMKTLRGGSFSTPSEYATTTHRIGWLATGAENYDETGFRCAKPAD